MNSVAQSQSLNYSLWCSSLPLRARTSPCQLSLTAAVSFNTPCLSSAQSIRVLNELSNQRLFHKFQPDSCPIAAGQRHPWSVAVLQCTQSLSQEQGPPPLHPEAFTLSPSITRALQTCLSMPSSHLMSQFRNRDASAATWESSGPKNI